ncbi:hypothetical protein PILCRDRAFT_10365 [Piloderma croceum F 1598]|uniref:DUF6589 domain-containing protein n=1 Tax=Piloderma croceum (strain F 1598) TaxID=765440 RepID=A0A0C3FIC6_PILCF|nr:hypothetical protein PILCRDRAFT_10365 [Piloderma croceum F 1598]
MKLLKHNVAEARTRGEVVCSIVLDNVQQYCLVHEEGIGKENQLKVGTAGTAVYNDDCAPGAFKAQDHIDRVAKKERSQMTIDSLHNDIDWVHIQNVMGLHWARVLVEYVPQLQHLQKELSVRFRSSPMRVGRKTIVQPLGTNSEREVENQGMMRAILDFENQMGIGAESSGNLSWIRGDGASFAAVGRIKKYLCPVADDFKSFRNRISTPEILHMRATNLNTNSDNHYGPAASADPSALSKSASCAHMKRPTDTKDVNFYPTVRSMSLYWEMQVIDCWREFFLTDNILEYFKKLADGHLHLKLDKLIELAPVLIRRYASQDAYEQALSRTHSLNAPANMKVPIGTPWSPPVLSATAHSDEMASEVNAANIEKGNLEKPPHVEADGFDGDRVLADSILFLENFGWWIEAVYAIPEGDMGRVVEILKIWIFTFAGSSNQNYKDYMLEFYCLLKYEASKDLKNAILNNMLVNLTGELGKWIEGDLMQEHYNRWLEDMVSKKAEVIEAGFGLEGRQKTHTSPHLLAESQLLLTMYRETELHRFRSRRTMGHAAKNQFNIGYNRLQSGKLADFLQRTTAYADIVAGVQKANSKGPGITAAVTQTLPDPDVLLEQAEKLHSAPTSPNPNESSSGSDTSTDDDDDGRSSTSSSSSTSDSGVDVSEKQLASGSYKSMYIDPATGTLINEWADEEGDDFEQDEESEDESQNEDEHLERDSWDDE